MGWDSDSDVDVDAFRRRDDFSVGFFLYVHLPLFAVWRNSLQGKKKSCMHA
jgi:hypothetical protein